MRGKRVVITGMGAVSPFGRGAALLMESLREARCGLSPLDSGIPGVDCRVAGLVGEIPELHDLLPRKFRRAMSPMSLFACLAAREAAVQAGLDPDRLPRAGVCLGSTMGSGQELDALFRSYVTKGHLDEVRTASFFKIMAHTAASSLALALGLTGRIVNPAAACAAGLQAVGLAFEAIAAGRETLMFCGGSEEYTPLTAATFDKIGAASHAEDPRTASRPFDARREGIVCSEGAGVLLLEEREHALARGATVLAEIGGFATCASPSDLAQPDAAATERGMREAVADAGCHVADIVHVNAHATGTQAGDAIEGQVIERLWGEEGVAVTSLKGGLGHALAASGALELMACVGMMREGVLFPGQPDFTPDPGCGRLRHVRALSPWTPGPTLKNSFALGGVSASLVLLPA